MNEPTLNGLAAWLRQHAAALDGPGTRSAEFDPGYRFRQWADAVDACERSPDFDRDNDGELLIDWSPANGRSLLVSLRGDGRLFYAFIWDDEKAHGYAQMPAPSPGS